MKNKRQNTDDLMLTALASRSEVALTEILEEWIEEHHIDCFDYHFY